MASSSSNAQVSYLGMYKDWMKANRNLNRDFTIPIEVLLKELKLADVLSKLEHELVEAEKTGEDKLWKLFTEIMPAKGKQGFNRVVEILTKNKYTELTNDLEGRLNGEWNTNSTFPVQAQAYLASLIKYDVDFMSKYWSDVIPVAKTETAFVQVQVLEHFKSENGKPVGSYREIFHKDEKTLHKRILIQADPGCGKTTYVNKLALDWANEDEYLKEKFDFVFLLALQTLTKDVFDIIKWFLPNESEQFFESYAKRHDSKILLILDGFDELVESSQWYSSVMGILNGQSMQFRFFRIIVTTRRSHVDKIPQQFRERSLLIKGFNEESMKQFLDKQHVPLPSVGQQSNFSRLLQTPLFCAIYCSLHSGGGKPIELEDSYDLIKSLVENSVTNTRKKKTVANVEDQLNEIGKFAFEMLDSHSLYILKDFCRSSEVIKPSFDLSRVNLDLLIKRTIPTRGVDRFQEDFSLPHQLIAEYLAARYFARSLTEEQLKQADASVFFSGLIPFQPTLDLPFVRFFLFELLFLYLEKKYEESAFDNFINLEVRFIWNIKSNKDIPSLDYVNHLNFISLSSELTNVSRFIPTLSKCRHLSSLRLSYCQLCIVQQLARCIDNNGLANLTHLYLEGNANVGSTPQLFTALSKCKHLQVLHLEKCKMTVESTTELARCIDNNGLANLTQLCLGWNANVGSTPQLFTALSKCKHLQVLGLQECYLTIESTTELARCIDNNGLANLTLLNLVWNRNVGLSTDLFHVLHKCRQLQVLSLSFCSMMQESLNIFLSTFNSNTFQQLDYIWLNGNEEIKMDDNFFIALEKCLKISRLGLSKLKESDLSDVGRKAKETLEQRGCQFQ